MKPATIPALVLGVLFAFISPAFGQQYEVIYPNGLTAIAKEPLPRQIYLAQKNVLKIRAEFFPKDKPDAPPSIVQATGFIEKNSSYIVSARHLLVETAMDLAGSYDELFNIDKNGILHGVNYDYRFFAVLDMATGRIEYPLEIAAMGRMGTFLDVILFRPLKKIPVKSLPLSNNVKTGDKVYVSGFTSQNTHYHKISGESLWFTSDEIKFTTEHIILAVLQNKTITSAGVKKLYRLFEPTQSGFSGGPVFNSTGQVIGIMIEKDTLFSFVISSEDIAAVIQSVK